MFEVFGRVVDVDVAEGTGVRSNHENLAREVQVDNSPAGAVAEVRVGRL